jgi:hypothetical protein
MILEYSASGNKVLSSLSRSSEAIFKLVVLICPCLSVDSREFLLPRKITTLYDLKKGNMFDLKTIRYEIVLP